MSDELSPRRRARRLQRDFLCAVVSDDLTVEGHTLNLTHQGIAVALAEPLSGHLDRVTVVLTAQNGALLRLPGHVTRHQSVECGLVLLGIRFSGLSVDATTALLDKCGLDSPSDIDNTATDSSPSASCAGLADISSDAVPALDAALIYSSDCTDPSPRHVPGQGRGRSLIDEMRRTNRDARVRGLAPGDTATTTRCGTDRIQ